MNSKLALVLMALAVLQSPRENAKELDRAERSTVVERIGALLVERYVYADMADRCAVYLRTQLAAGRYDSLADPAVFARALTEEMRSACDDRHFEVVVRETAPTAAQPSDPNAWIDDLRRRNYDFYEVRRLPENVGYLDLRSFPPPSLAGATAAGAMAFLAGSDAVIIDLRKNSGGTGDMVTFLATYFFDRPTALTNTYRRAENATTQDRTLAWVPGSRILNADLFILTSAATFSAAEGLAFSLQSLRRATIVGERTRGGANAGRYTDVSERFRVFISNAHATSAATGQTWDKVGIIPDIATDAGDALRLAHAEALKRLIAKSSDPARKRELERVAVAENARWSNPPAHAESLRRFEGDYQLYRVRVRGGRLTYSHDGGPERTLLPLSARLFAVEEIDGRRLEFRGAALVVQYPDGSEELFQRTGSPGMGTEKK